MNVKNIGCRCDWSSQIEPKSRRVPHQCGNDLPLGILTKRERELLKVLAKHVWLPPILRRHNFSLWALSLAVLAFMLKSCCGRDTNSAQNCQ